MPACSPVPRRCAVALCLSLGLGLATGPLARAEQRAESKPPAGIETKIDTPEPKPVAKTGPKAEGKVESRAGEKAAEPVETAASEPPDPMDVLRDRLAEKIGATKVKEANNRSVLRISSNAATPGGAREPAGGARRAVRRSPPAAEAAAQPAHWDYAGAGGPQRWGELNPDFAQCTSGQRQSPIDIRDGIKVDLEPVHVDYKLSAFRVIDTGRTVQVNVAPGNSIDVMGRHFELVQFHFHRPSEERVDGRQFDMVMHLVHKDLDGRLAVIAVLLDRGSAQPIVQSIWNNLPLEKNEELAAPTLLDPNQLLPADRSYFTYMGSLTTPPCSEGVLWMVMKQPVAISPEQIGVFARLYPMNARPIQAASGRLIKQSN